LHRLHLTANRRAIWDMPQIHWNHSVWDGSYSWTSAGEEWSEAWGGSTAQWFGCLYPRIRKYLPAKRILEIAPGFGRWTQFLIPGCDEFKGIDLSSKCVEACKIRFPLHRDNFHQNDGLDLGAAAGEYDFIFSFDSLVHADLDVFESYIPQILAKLTGDGVAFIHHSNFPASGSPRNIHIRSQNVDSEVVAGLIGKFGGSIVVQERINWVGSPELVDCLTTFSRQSVQPPVRFDNPHFMTEARIIRDFHSRYR
jgi:SAM-dependent methyltransferase